MNKCIDDVWSDSTITYFQADQDVFSLHFARYDGSRIVVKFCDLVSLQLNYGWYTPELVEALVIPADTNAFWDSVIAILLAEDESVQDLVLYQVISKDQSLLVEVVAKEYVVEFS